MESVSLVELAEKKEKRRNHLRKATSVLGFLGPYGICFFLFFCFPLILGIVMSFGKFDGTSVFPSQFIGFDNYAKLFSDTVLARDFWGSVWTTMKFCLVIVPLSILIPLGLALIVNIKPPGYKFFRACIYLPSIFPLTATGLILLKMFSYRNGFINSFFDLSVDWFGDVKACWFMVGLFCLWTGIGGNFIILCAGLNHVDQSLHEAANMDGCNAFVRFFHVTLPGISSQLFLCVFSTFTGYMNLYGQLYILADGVADSDAMKSAVYRIQDMLMGSSKSYGYAAAMGICLGIIIICIAIVQMIVTRQKKGGNRYAKEYLAYKKHR